MTRRINVVGAVIVRDNTVLAARRGQFKALPGMWEFPGGKLEKGETPEAALRREIQEELDCRIEVGQKIQTTSYQYDFGIVTLTTFYARLTSGEPRLSEHTELRWIRAAELHALDWAPADIPSLRHVVEYLTAPLGRSALRKGTSLHP